MEGGSTADGGRREAQDGFLPSLSRKRLFIQEIRVPSRCQRKGRGQLKSLKGVKRARSEPGPQTPRGRRQMHFCSVGRMFCLERQRRNK